MADGLIDSAAKTGGIDRRIYGVALAQVSDNRDLSGQGRVQVRLPWMPEVEPWARVAVDAAGMMSGTWFIPQVGDEVLVAFNHGDIRDVYVIGSLWNGIDRPPVGTNPLDATNKRLIRTPLQHELEFDDAMQSITITTNTQHTITMDPSGIELSTAGGASKITLSALGEITIEGAISIDLKAPLISITADASLELKGNAMASLEGGASCTIKAATVNIN